MNIKHNDSFLSQSFLPKKSYFDYFELQTISQDQNLQIKKRQLIYKIKRRQRMREIFDKQKDEQGMKIKWNKKRKYRQIGNTLYMIKTPNFKQTKTCLADLISTTAPTKSSMFEKPNPFNWIQQPTLKPVSIPIVYDDFIYTDKLTKKRIKMLDAKLSYETGRNARKSSCSSASHNTQNQERKKRPSRFAKHTSQTELEKELTDLNECFLMLKSTEMFKLNSLRQKIFRSMDRTAKQTAKETPKSGSSSEITPVQIKDMLTKKKKIRQILQDSVKEANITQFRKYFSDENHKLNNKILAMNKHIPKSFNKSNIEKIIERLEDAEKKEENICNFIKKEEEDVEFPGEQKLRTELIEYMKKLIRHNGEYLVTPEKKKLLYQRLYKNVGLKSNQSQDVSHEKNLTLEQFSIEPTDQNQTFDEDESSKVNIDIPTQKSILQPIFNNDQPFVKKQNVWTKFSSKNSKFKDEKQKKRTQYPFISREKKQKHKKQNSCINLTNQFRPKGKDSFCRPSTELNSFLNSFTFNPCIKNHEISLIKTKFQRNRQLTTCKLSLKQQKFLFMVENNLLFDVEKQILMNEDYLFMKDKNDNNLLQICAKNHSTEMFAFIVERLMKCGLRQEARERWGKNLLKDRLVERNKHGKDVFDVARLYHAEEIMHGLQKLKEDMNLREYLS